MARGDTSHCGRSKDKMLMIYSTAKFLCQAGYVDAQ